MVHVRLLGQVTVTVDDAPLSGEAAQRRRIALLALLCVPPLRPVSRDRLMLYLWPDNGTESARHLVSVAIHALRSALGHDALVAVRDDIALEASWFQVDVIDFVAALARGDHEQAVSLYGGPFMDGFHAGPLPEFDQWLESERASLQGRYVEALEAVASSRAEAGDHARAVEAWQHLATLDPYSSHVALGLMRALAAGGNRAAAIRHAAVHRQLLESGLETGPDPEVEDLAELLRREAARSPQVEPHLVQAPGALEAIGSDAGVAEAFPALTPTGAGNAVQPDTDAATAQAAPAPPPGTGGALPAEYARKLRRAHIWMAAAVAIGAVGVLGGAGLTLARVWDRLELAPYAGDAPRAVAVLPFEDLTPEAREQTLGARLAEQILDELGGPDGLRVASSTSSSAARRRNLTAREIGDSLRVTWIVEGSVDLTADSLHLSVDLLSAQEDLRIWRHHYDRPWRAAGDLPEQVAREVATSLGKLSRTSGAAHGGT